MIQYQFADGIKQDVKPWCWEKCLMVTQAFLACTEGEYYDAGETLRILKKGGQVTRW
jgi:hypothetical protein